MAHGKSRGREQLNIEGAQHCALCDCCFVEVEKDQFLNGFLAWNQNKPFHTQEESDSSHYSPNDQ